MNIKKEKIKVFEMTCTSCEGRVERAVRNLDGVVNVKANFSEQYALIEYDEEVLKLDEIIKAINSAGYTTQRPKDYKFMGIIIIAAAIALLGFNTSGFNMEDKLTNASYAVLFLVGVLTSIHCVGMCGGIMLSQSIGHENSNKFEAIKPALLYNVGRVISYAILGGIIGAVGSVFSLSIKSKAAMQLIAGIFMIMMGFNMAGFSFFRKFQIRMPGFACKAKNKSKSPFIVGILNGLMPCGPLQTMQLFALGTGSMTKGALSMFVFAVGTVPLMLTFGAVSGLLSKGYTKKILKLSGVLVIVLGLIMGNRGLAIFGVNLNPMTALALSSDSSSKGNSNTNVGKAVMKDGVQEIVMSANNKGFTPNAFYVQKGVPVRWIVNGDQLNTCNNAIIIPSLNREFKINKGENVIEFTPGDKDINFSCWMGMINGVIKVVDNLEGIDTSQPDPSLPPASTGPSCCARPIDDGSQSQTVVGPSIYGDDISKVPTDVIVGKAGKDKSFTFEGIGYELKPLIAVVSSTESTKLTFDFSKFDNASGEIIIIDGLTGETITSFTAKQGVNEIEFAPAASGVYGVVKGDTILGLIEAVENVEAADLEEVRSKFLQ